MSDLNSFLAQQLPAGVYEFHSSTSRRTIQKFAEKKSWRFAYLNGRYITDKQSFLKAIAQALVFPDYFGSNWDAFEECIRDLSWAKANGYLILFEASTAFTQTTEWQTAKEILQSAALEKKLFILLR